MPRVSELAASVIQNIIDVSATAGKTLITPVFNVKGYGAVGDGVADDTSAIQAAINDAAAANYGVVFLPPGNFKIAATLTLPAKVSIEGSGMWASKITVSGAVHGIVGVHGGPDYEQAGHLRDFTLIGTNGALKGIHLEYRQEIQIERVNVNGFAQQGIYLNRTIMASLNECLLGGNGSAGYGQVEVDNSTTFKWWGSYISGAPAGTVAGLRIDRTGPIVIMGGAIETTCIPLQLAGKSEASVGVGPGLIAGIDLENPNNGADCYIQAGYGWTGATGQAVTRITFQNVLGTPSGSTSVAIGARLKHTDSCHMAGSALSLPSGATCTIWLEGLTNTRFTTGVNSGPSPFPFIFENGAEKKSARPDMPWQLNGQMVKLARGTSFAQNSATPSAKGFSYFSSNSTVPTTITNILDGEEGQLLYIFFGDGSTTLRHMNGGTGQIWLKGGVNLTVPVGSVLSFFYDNGGIWRQI